MTFAGWMTILAIAAFGAVIYALYRTSPEYFPPTKPDYSTLEIPPGEPEIRMDVAYGTEKMPEFTREYSPGQASFADTLFHVATVTLYFNDVAKASIRKLGLHEREIADNIRAITDKKTQQHYRDAPSAYAPYGWVSAYEQRQKVIPEDAFDRPIKLWRKTNADLQGAVHALKNELANLKNSLHAARTGDRQSFEI